MFSVFVIAKESKTVTELHSQLIQNGFACTVAANGSNAIEQFAAQSPDLVLAEMNGHSSIWELYRETRRQRPLPIIALVSRTTLDSLDGHLEADDFVIEPYNARELVLRVKRLLHRTSNVDSSEQIRCGDLLIDLSRCEVSVAGKRVMLTFKEYELLRFLAGNRGRVFAREALLNKVWGYEYYGGDRTVDVHVRRLRSKIEDSSHTFIETVRNIGYKFRGEL